MSVVVKSELRDITGKNAARRIRREGKIPAILYGRNMDSTQLTLNKKDIVSILKLETGENTIFQAVYDSVKKNAMIKELQIDPVTDEILHVDLIEIAMDKSIRVTVPCVLTGEAIGVKAEGGFVDFITREIDIQCLPKDIPEHIEIDISSLHLHQSVKIEAVKLPARAELLSDPQLVIVLIEAPTKEEEYEVEEKEEEEVIAEEEEPEVIKKEKTEEEQTKE
ncbi:50S ribosomal protein L25 [Acidobacteriota bacterium]